MSGTKWGVTPKIPAQITGSYPIIVTKTGLSYNISFATVGTYVSKRQFFGAVSTLYSMTTLFASVTSNPEGAAWWQFYGGSFVQNSATDPIYALTKTTFSLSTAEMDNIFTVASGLPF